MKKGKGGNPYHDPKTGQFTTAGSGKVSGGASGMRVSGTQHLPPKGDWFDKPRGITRDQGAALIKNLRAMSRRKKK